MRLRTVAAFSMTLGMLAATIGFTGPASAAPAVWVMPDVQTMVLKGAIKEIRDVTGSAKLNLRVIDRRNGNVVSVDANPDGQKPMNKTNWMVCAQRPGPGGTISQKSKRVYLYVKRFSQASCWR